MGWLRPLKYDFSRSLISSKCSGCWQKLHSAEEWGFSPRPTSFQVFTSFSVEKKKPQELRVSIINWKYEVSTTICQLTDKVFHHLRGVVRCCSNTQKLVSSGYSGIVDGLNVNVVPAHHEVTHLCVFLSIRHLDNILKLFNTHSYFE